MQPAFPTLIETAPWVCMAPSPKTPAVVSFSPSMAATAVAATLSDMDDSPKTTAPPLLDTISVLPCSRVEETAAVQQSQPAVTAVARGGMQPPMSSPILQVPPCLNVAEQYLRLPEFTAQCRRRDLHW
ncbi:UNVERIFIED_CONTAM: hypothetical protein Sangu_3140000 [Sesamum angustifolium]|uniref:Uncharacterized protein n=1 Tax=Sesamum angustifolium TaxID=2727405 RepID=A0AAW2JZW3_9LAMI